MPEEEDELTETGEKAIKSVAKGAGIVSLGLIFSNFAGYLFNVVTARFLGSDGYGVISLAVAVVGFLAPLCVLGIDSGIKRYVAFYRGKGDESRTKGTITSGLKIVLLPTVFISILLFIFSEPIAIRVFNEPAASFVFRIFALALPFKILLKTLISITDAFQEMKYRVVSYYVMRKGTRILLVLGFFYVGLEILGAAYAIMLSYVLGFSTALFFVARKIAPKLSQVKSNLNYKELIAYSWPLLFVSIMTKILGYTDKVMLGYFEASSQVGVYNAALITAAFITIGLSAVKKITMPVFSDLLGKEEGEELSRTFRTSNKWLIAITLPLFFVLLLFPNHVMNLIFGLEYVVASTALSILAVAYFLKACLGLGSSFLRSIERTKVILLATLAGGFLNIVMNLLLIPRLGIEGAGYAYLLSTVVVYGLYMLYTYRYLGESPYRQNIFKPLISAILAVIPVYLLFQHVLPPTNLLLIPAFVLFLAIYTLLFLVFGGLEEDDIVVLKAVERKTGMKIKWLRNFVKRFI